MTDLELRRHRDPPSSPLLHLPFLIETKKRLRWMVCSLLWSAAVEAAILSDQAGLQMELGSDGRIGSVELNGVVQPSGATGGFYLQEPGSSARVYLAGSIETVDGRPNLTLTSTALQATVRAELVEGDGFIEVTGELEDLTGTDRGLWLGFNLPVNTIGWKWGQTLSTSPVISNGNPAYAEDNNMVPIPAVWTESGGIALCIPPTHPCVFEVGSDAGGLRLQMAFGLSPDTAKFPSKASFRFRLYSIDGAWGLRDALAKYYDWYPDYYEIEPWVMTALDHHHDWIGMNYVGDSFNTTRLINSADREYQAYTKTSARIQGIANPETIDTDEEILDAIAHTTTIQHYEKNGNPNSRLIVEGRQALLNSVCFNPDQTFGIFSYSEDGIDFPHNCDPDLFGDRSNMPIYADMYLRKAEDLTQVGGEGEVGTFVSIHWDRLGGWSNFLNYRREHFHYIDHPLTFDQQGRVCIHTQFTNYELFDAYRELIKTGGLFHEAAGMKEYNWAKLPNQPAGQEQGGQFFLASVVAGGWQEGSFKPIGLGGFDFERMVVGRKSYRISSGNIISRREAPTLDAVKAALAKTTAYGFACALQWQYFYPPEHPDYLPGYSWYTKPDHKALWDRYEPASLAIRLAGWEPVTHAASLSNTVQLQRFGRGEEIYLTVWGPSPAGTVEIVVDGTALGLGADTTFDEMVSNTPVSVVRQGDSWRLTVAMEADMTRVIRITGAGALSPVFSADPLTRTAAFDGTPYTGPTLTGAASTTDGSAVLTYAKLAGPAWLHIAPDGTLSGTPARTDLGLNSWTVEASDGLGGSNRATLQIEVIPSYTTWADQHALVQGPDGDDDGDGDSNHFEFLAGLVPTDAASVFRARVARSPGAPGDLAIIFDPIIGGRTYAVKWNPSLDPNAWSLLSGATTRDAPLGDGRTERTVTDTPPIAESRFYAIEVSVP